MENQTALSVQRERLLRDPQALSVERERLLEDPGDLSDVSMAEPNWIGDCRTVGTLALFDKAYYVTSALGPSEPVWTPYSPATHVEPVRPLNLPHPSVFAFAEEKRGWCIAGVTLSRGERGKRHDAAAPARTPGASFRESRGQRPAQSRDAPRPESLGSLPAESVDRK